MPQKNDGPDVAFLQLVLADHLEDGIEDFLVGVGNLDPQDGGRVEQPVDVLLQAENGGFFILHLITANALEYAESVMERVGQDVDVGLVPGDEFPVEPDFFRFFQGETFRKMG